MVTYLAGCGLQMCPMLLSKGYPDIGWNPCGGERYLDFLRFAVFVNGNLAFIWRDPKSILTLGLAIIGIFDMIYR